MASERTSGRKIRYGLNYSVIPYIVNCMRVLFSISCCAGLHCYRQSAQQIPFVKTMMICELHTCRWMLPVTAHVRLACKINKCVPVKVLGNDHRAVNWGIFAQGMTTVLFEY
jgi:hypothetical protein